MSHLLAPTLFSRLFIKIQQEELRLANIPNFEQCKFCTFGTSKFARHIYLMTIVGGIAQKKKKGFRFTQVRVFFCKIL
jgi:hypothetical protein